LRHHGGRIAEANRARSPVSGSTRRSLTRRRGHLHRSGAGKHLAGLVGAVAHHQPEALGAALGGEPGNIGVDLGLQGFGEHPTGTFSDDVVDQRRGGRVTADGGAVIAAVGLPGGLR
jgi:hypothetical protein